jgi:FMN-dependent NADH-azoreductase
MAHLLHIDSSPRGERSQSRRMTKEFVEAWKLTHPGDTVTYRDVGRHPVPHVDELWVAAAFTSPEERTSEMWEAISLSEQLVDEFLAADIYVIGLPMYNFSVPSAFKAYIDQIVRIGRTADYEPEDTENPYKPLVLGRKMFVITARGDTGFSPGERFGKMNHQDPYIETIFGFMGVTDITFIHVEKDQVDSEGLAKSIANARAKILELAAS